MNDLVEVVGTVLPQIQSREYVFLDPSFDSLSWARPVGEERGI